MSQSVKLAVSGLYTSQSDYEGIPPGALDVADNVECRYKNLVEPRRGFEGLADSEIAETYFKRLINFYIEGEDRIVSLTDDGDLLSYTGAGWEAVPGEYSADLINPDDMNAKSRFVVAGQNLYTTSSNGLRSFSSGVAAQTLIAGVPKGLNLEAATNGADAGFFTNNVVLATTGDLTDTGFDITNLDDSTGIEVDLYVSGTDTAATGTIQDLTYTSELLGALGNAITIEYTDAATGGAANIGVVGTAITVAIESGVTTADTIVAAINASAAALLLVSVEVSGTGSDPQTAPTGPTNLTGGADNPIPADTQVSSVTPEATLLVAEGDTTIGSTTLSNMTSIAGLVAGVLVSGTGIPSGAKVVSALGSDVVIDQAAYQTIVHSGTVTNEIIFTSPLIVTMDQAATETLAGTVLRFYRGAQVGYRMVFGRTETDINGSTITRIGTASSVAIANNTSAYETNTTVTGTLPKNSSDSLTFVRLYRSAQTDSIDISPLDQYRLVYERLLVPADFVARTVTITDSVDDSLRGIPLYSGSDQEGILQSNDPSPVCWDMCKFRDFTLFGNITRPSTLNFTIVAVGAPSGIQIGDEITIEGEFAGVAYTETYIAAAAESQAAREFKVFSAGTNSQNIADTADSLIRVINYDNDLPVHALLQSTQTDLPGQILLEADVPSIGDTFTITADLHQSAYDPELDAVESDVNTINNGIAVSKTGEFEAVPAANMVAAGDTSSNLLRLIPLRDYVIVLKTDGIYKLQGLTPGGLVCNPFDLTTKIIGAETAVSLNSGVWMLSNQGVVSISDGGVDAKSIPIDNQLNRLIGSYIDNLTDKAFAIGYESDRKYILAVPESDNEWCEVEYNFNYVTSCWTTWSRNLYTGFVHSNEGKLYIAKADTLDKGVSKERKSATYRDYVDEAFDAEIVSIDDYVLTLATVEGIDEGDILYQTSTLFSVILEVDLEANTITVQAALSFTVGACSILKAYPCTVTWKQIYGDNPAYQRQYSEGIVLFKNTRFQTANMSFVTDFSQGTDLVPIEGTGVGLWGLFAWGSLPWGGSILPSKVRFYVPQDKQIGSYILPTIEIHQGYSDFGLQGISITYFNISMEDGL